MKRYTVFRFAGWAVLVFALVLVFAHIAEAARSRKAADEIKKAPPFDSKGIWFNTKPLGKKVFRDKLTLVYFWEYTAIHSLRELPTLKAWRERYHPYGLEMIFVHAPEFEFSKNSENVKAALERLKISVPVTLDNEFKLWDAYKARSWPAKYLVDGKGVIVHSRQGEGGYAAFEQKIRESLGSLRPNSVLPDPLFAQEPERHDSKSCGEMSMETSTGYRQPGWWASEIAEMEGLMPNQTLFYRDRGERSLRGFFVHGRWTNHAEYFEHARDTENFSDYLGVVYFAHEVYAVIHPRRDGDDTETLMPLPSDRIYVTRDEMPVPPPQRGTDLHEDETGETYFVPKEPRLYYLVSSEDDEPHELKLWPLTKGVGISGFSFSNRCLSEFDHL